MTDRLAFKVLLALAGALLFCLGTALLIPLWVVWSAAAFELICCRLLSSYVAIVMPTGSLPSPLASAVAVLLLSVMAGNGLLTAWCLWQATRCLTRLTQVAHLSKPPVVARLASRLKLTDSLVVLPNRIPFSFCYGLWRPRICISLGMVETLTEAELEAVLCHEAYHLRRREPLRMAVAICLSRFLFFAPIIAELRDRYLVEKELSADAAAVAITGRAALARAMHKLITRDRQLMLPMGAAVAGLSVTAQRIDHLINPLAKPGWAPSRRCILTTLAVFAVGCPLVAMALG